MEQTVIDFVFSKISWSQVLIGAGAAFLVNIVIQWMRLPGLKILRKPEFRDRSYEKRPAQKVRFVRVIVQNNSPKWFLKHIVGGSLAPRCRGRITFFNQAGEKLFASPMPARWAGSAEMVLFTGQCSAATPAVGDTRNIILHDHNLYKPTSWIDIYPGSTESLDVAARLDEEDECYGWNNESYILTTTWRNKDRKLGPNGTITRASELPRRQRKVKAIPTRQQRLTERF